MPGIEKETLADGFRVCLFGVETDAAQGGLECAAALFDGGRRTDDVHVRDRLYAPSTAHVNRLRSFLARVAAPPHVLAVHGRGWKPLLAQVLPDYVAGGLRILDLVRTAAALHPELPARPSADDLRRSYCLGAVAETGGVASPAWEALLWAVIAQADRQELSWPQLLAAADKSVERPPFETFRFDESALDAVPPAPGVYTMRDDRGAVLYIGKAAHLARRLRDYFRPGRERPPKLDAIWERVRRFEYRLVGSELEALLLENRLIAAHLPDLNVQRRVAEGTSRYAFPVMPVVILCPSTQSACLELFFLCADSLRQYRLALRRPGPKALAAAAQACFANRGPPRAGARGATATDWGPEGGEIAGRYFSRFRNRLPWTEVNLAGGADAFAERLISLARSLPSQHPEPGEFRMTDADADA